MSAVQPQSKREPSHPVLDERAFQELLSAAYVMQEHNLRLRKAAAPKAVVPTPVVPPPIVTPKPAALAPTPAQVIPMPLPAQKALPETKCEECGSTLAPGEFFCESCGAPIAREPSALQKSWASLWEMHHATEAVETKPSSQPKPAATTQSSSETEEIDLFPAELEEIVGQFSPAHRQHEAKTEAREEEEALAPAHDGIALVPTATHAVISTQAAEVAHAHPSPWGSASKARAWLESLRGEQPFREWWQQQWRLHRGHIYIAFAAAVLLMALLQWATQPVPGSGASAGRDLSPLEQLLINLGMAEAPATTTTPAPGNPDTRVWVDVHTALYYCPGAELYGKAADGKVMTQREAQREHFQPSTLKACD